MEDRLRSALSCREKVCICDPRRVSSAVLIPLYRKDGQYHILFIQRSNRVKDHKGQIAFPGGAYEAGDASLRDTALREAAEEVGLNPDDVRVLGELDDIRTIGSGYVISPYVGLIPWPCRIEVDRWETEGVIEVPLSVLLDEKSVRRGRDVVDGVEIDTYFYHHENHVIWGATARILNQLLGVISTVVAEG